MNEKVFNAAVELAKIYDVLEDDDEKINVAVAREHREKMFGVMRKFFVEEPRDDFVTLFGIYCNIYIRNNFHQVLPEENFGVAELWDVVTDEKFREYLLKIRHGIFEQNGQDFFDAIELFDEYSLPHLYLFVFAAERFDDMTGDDNFGKRNEFLEFMQEHYNKMNAGLREYVLGTGNFIRDSFNPALDENFLPYVKAVDKQQEHVFNVAKALVTWYPTYKNLHDKFYFEHVMTQIVFPTMESEFNVKMPKPPEEILSTEQKTEFQMAFAVMKEKLDLLEKIFNPDKNFAAVDDEEYDEDVDDEDDDNWRDSDAIVFRVAYLDIPIKISNAGNFLLDQMEKLRLQREKEKIQQSKDKLVKDFTHRYKNLRATRLGEIAESLLRTDDEQQKLWGRELLLEQARKETLNKEAAMLNLRYNDRADELVTLLKDSLADDGKNISDVLQTAILYCVIEFFYDETGKDSKRMRKNLGQLWDNLNDKKISFEREVIFDKKNCADWLTENGLNLQIDVDDSCKKISVQPDDYAEIFLRAIFVELFKNFLKHSEANKPVALKIFSDTDTLKVSMHNSITAVKKLKAATRYGLSSMDETLKTIYIGSALPVPEKCVRYTQDAGNFFTELEMPVEIFLMGGADK